ncbi:MAG: GspE/PulE family protein [Sneathiellales bacterium]|nr:GspE/PulE family protein [Sneathiellales bacterium]
MAITETTLINAGVQLGLVDNEQLPELRLKARRERIKLIEAVTREMRFPVSALYQAVAELRSLPFLSAKDLKPNQEFIDKIPVNLMVRRNFMPVTLRDGKHLLAMADPDDQVSLDSVRRLLGVKIEAGLADTEALSSALRRSGISGGEVEASGSETGATEVLEEVLQDSYLRRATDIHFEPDDKGMRVRFRVDGHLQDFRRPLSVAEREGVLTRLKVLAGLDISEQRIAQDGGMSYQFNEWDIKPLDIRMATVPTRYGERITLRLMGQGTDGLTMEELGMPRQILELVREAVKAPHGLVLVTGPTGSGKSTTLYAGLRELDADDLNILTVEDPIEQIVSGITQVQVTGKLTFPGVLRSFLRHDPDVILVGEIRDPETADTALKAGLTGHLVLSTLHTNDSVSAITRLIDIGCERYLISSTVIGVLAQRLLRRLCNNCKEKGIATEEERQFLGLPAEGDPVEIWRPKGCPSCLGSGYKERVGLYEYLQVDDSLAQLIGEGAGEREIHENANNLYSLIEDGRNKIMQGVTSIEEVKRLSFGDD